MKKPIVSIIYVYYNTPEEIIKSIASLKEAIGRLSYQVIVVDNASVLAILQKLKNNSAIKIIHNKKNKGYGAGMNQGARQAAGEFFVIANPDTRFGKRSILELINRLKKDEKIGVIGPQMVDNSGNLLPTISGSPVLPNGLFAFSFLNTLFSNNIFSKRYWLSDLSRKEEQYVDVISGACLVVRKKTFQKLKGFDERFFMYFEEADFCLRLKQMGYSVLYYPKAVITHQVGKSNQDKELIKKYFEKSRFLFFHKYNGLLLSVLSESFIRFITFTNVLLIFILSLSVFINLFELSRLMLFIGDIGRDYLAARNMLLDGQIPLVGIPSSVSWLHQGPLSIYIIGIAFLISSFHPVAPAVIFAILGVIATFFVFILGKRMFSRDVGFIAALFFATSPLVVINSRMPYHTSLIPLFSSFFFLLLFLYLNGKNKLLPLITFTLGILLQFELSNAVLIVVLFTVLFFYKPIFSKRNIIYSIISFKLGILPFILYDLSHGFIQTLGFLVWIINRVRLFFGLSYSSSPTSFQVSEAFYRIYQQFTSFVFPSSIIIAFVILFTTVIILFYNRKSLIKYQKSFLILFSWLFIPLLGFIIHASPGTAYFPLLFPVVSLFVGLTPFFLKGYSKVLMMLILVGICLFNSYQLIKNEYYLITKNALHTLPPESYSLGYSYEILTDVANFIVKDAKGEEIRLDKGDPRDIFKTSTNNFEYLVWYYGGNLSPKASKAYIIYEGTQRLPKTAHVIYNNNYFYVVRGSGS